jgi:hypothetical protein
MVPGCGVSADGKMLMCSPHWAFLTRDLREAIRDKYDELEHQRKLGNPRRATRNEYALLVADAVEELDAARARLQVGMERRLPADGIAWRRRQRQLELEAASARPAREEAAP